MIRYFIAALALFVLALGAWAQNPPPIRKAPPSPPPPPATDQQQFVSYWTTETGWNSELQLRNNAVGKDVTVTPVFRLPDGTETALAAVTIKPQEVKAIDLDAAITAATPQLVGVYGSVVLRYRSPSSASLYVAMMIRKTGHPIAFHIDARGEDQTQDVGSREGVWWLPRTTTSDYLVLTNQGKNTIPLDLSLYNASGKESKRKVMLGPGATSRYSVRQLAEALGIAGSYGGLKISANAHAGSLDTLHFLYDETAGFSAILKMFDYNPTTKLEERDYAETSVWTLRAPMLALSNPDPALAFLPGTRLQPQLLLRNTTANLINAALRFNWRTDAGATGKGQGPTLRLNPYETRRVDVAALQDGKTLPADANWASVTITTDSKPDELMAVAASYDATLRYGAQTPFTDQLAFKWEGGMWEYDPYHDSIITAGNGGTKPAQAAFTIFYNQGTQRYDLEQTLQPDEQMWIDVGKLIREHVADKNGKTLPADLTSGSYEFRDLTNTGVGTLFEGKVIYDKTYGHVAYGCAQCCGYQRPSLFYNPLGIPFLGTSPNGVTSYEVCQDAYFDISSDFYNNWSTVSTTIATADSYGTHTGHAVGSTNSSTWANLLLGGGRTFPCPRARFTPGGGDTVTPTVTIGSFSQNPILQGSTATVTITVNPSATVSLAITSSGSGAANFDGQGGGTTKTISGTTTVTIYGSTASTNSGDLTLTASYNGTMAASIAFTVTSGVCTLGGEHDTGSGPTACPSSVTLQSSYTISQYCATCTYTCVTHADPTWITNAPCGTVTSHQSGFLTGGVTSTATGTFSASDCYYHYSYFITTATDAHNVKTNDTGASLGLKCTYHGTTQCP